MRFFVLFSIVMPFASFALPISEDTGESHVKWIKGRQVRVRKDHE